MEDPIVSIFVDYDSPLARRVADDIWSGLSRAATDTGYTRATSLWKSLRGVHLPEPIPGSLAYIFVVGQDSPDAVDALQTIVASRTGEAPRVYGVVVAVPDHPSPLAGSLLYQGVERLTRGGVKPGAVEPALLHAVSAECEGYARRLLERLGVPGK